MTDVLSSIRRAILEYLSRRDYSQYEILQKCLKKGFLVTDIQLIIQEYKKNNLLNDEKFTQTFIEYKRQKGYGPLRILAELKHHQIAPQVIADYLKITDNAWYSEIKRVWLKQFKGQLPHDLKTRAKHIRFLQYRGFTHEQISSVISS